MTLATTGLMFLVIDTPPPAPSTTTMTPVEMRVSGPHSEVGPPLPPMACKIGTFTLGRCNCRRFWRLEKVQLS